MKFRHRFICLLIAVILVTLGAISTAEARSYTNYEVTERSMDLREIMQSTESCESCHAKVTPRVYEEHMQGEHGQNKVSCAACHGKDHSNLQVATAKRACLQCHQKETQAYFDSDHSKAWQHMWDNARYKQQPKAMQQQGCEQCHDISYGVEDGRCDYCHSKHTFSKEEAKRPEACFTCHMGPDHPQMEAYQNSMHLFSEATCVTCHLQEGDHNANKTLGPDNPDMINTCNKCHTYDFNKQWLDGAKMVSEQGQQIVAEAKLIIEQLDKEGLLQPNPKTRPANPVEGNVLILGGHQLYEGTSRPEKLYFEMYKYMQSQLIQGAYHQNFKLAAYNGLMPLQQQLEELKGEAQLLRELAQGKGKLTPIATVEPFVAKTEEMNQVAFTSSVHGVLPEGAKGPTCGSCHELGGEVNRQEVLGKCKECHTTQHVQDFDANLKEIEAQAEEFASQGLGITKELQEQGIVSGRPGNLKLVLELGDANSEYKVAHALVQRLNYFQNKLTEDSNLMLVGVRHLNPDYTHWYGNAAAKSDLIELEDGAQKLLTIKKTYGDTDKWKVWLWPGLAVLGITGLSTLVILRKRHAKLKE